MTPRRFFNLCFFLLACCVLRSAALAADAAPAYLRWKADWVSALRTGGVAHPLIEAHLKKHPLDKPYLLGLNFAIKQPAYQVKNHFPDPKTSLAQRVKPPPPALMDYLKKIDANAAYTPHVPTAADQKAVEKVLAGLPPLWRRALKERLLGVYFVAGFISNGYTDVVVDDSGEPYAFMVFRASVLSQSAQALLQAKEATVYKPDESGLSVSVLLEGNATGLDYILSHEVTHAVDYLLGLTPWPEEANRIMRQRGGRKTFSQGVWATYDQPMPDSNFAGRQNVTFYGFGGGPKLALAEAPALYNAWARSPFVTLYASKSWAEELAELVAVNWITQGGKQRLVFGLTQGRETVVSVEPLKSPLVQKRMERARRQ